MSTFTKFNIENFKTHDNDSRTVTAEKINAAEVEMKRNSLIINLAVSFSVVSLVLGSMLLGSHFLG